MLGHHLVPQLQRCLLPDATVASSYSLPLCLLPLSQWKDRASLFHSPATNGGFRRGGEEVINMTGPTHLHPEVVLHRTSLVCSHDSLVLLGWLQGALLKSPECSRKCCSCFSRSCPSHAARYDNAHKLNFDPKNSKSFILILGSRQVSLGACGGRQDFQVNSAPECCYVLVILHSWGGAFHGECIS